MSPTIKVAFVNTDSRNAIIDNGDNVEANNGASLLGSINMPNNGIGRAGGQGAASPPVEHERRDEDSAYGMHSDGLSLLWQVYQARHIPTASDDVLIPTLLCKKPPEGKQIRPDRSYGIVEAPRAFAYQFNRGRDLAEPLAKHVPSPVGFVAKAGTGLAAGLVAGLPQAAGKAVARVRPATWALTHSTNKWNDEVSAIRRTILDAKFTIDGARKLAGEILRRNALKYGLKYQETLRLLEVQDRLMRKIADHLSAVVNARPAESFEKIEDYKAKYAGAQAERQAEWDARQAPVQSTSLIPDGFAPAVAAAIQPLVDAATTAAVAFVAAPTGIAQIAGATAVVAVHAVAHGAETFSNVDYPERRKAERSFAEIKAQLKTYKTTNAAPLAFYHAYVLAKNMHNSALLPELASQYLEVHNEMIHLVLDWLEERIQKQEARYNKQPAQKE